MPNFYRAVIAGTHSRVGKTTWSLALMAYFRKKGFTIQPFKVGPDYLDPGFHHQLASPRRSRNLDRFLLSAEYVQRSFNKHTAGAELALVEGVMGLFDGRTGASEEGSTAEIAKLLWLPVFLVIDGSGLARSTAALLKGYQTFDRKVNLAGVFVNRVGSEGHFQSLRECIEKETGLPVVGWLPEAPEIAIRERHLGLQSTVEETSLSNKVERLVKLFSRRFDEARFLAITKTPRLSLTKANGTPSSLGLSRIGVAYDQAFSFYYEDNFDLLREAGAELLFFSPLSDAELPEVDALYLGGGFPEIYARPLSENHSLKTSIQKFHEAGGMVYAECGGLIYLTEAFLDSEGREFPLVGLLPGKIRTRSKLQHFGYHELECLRETFLFPQGKRLRSHEFQDSSWERKGDASARPYRVGEREEGYYDGQILASYQHLHFGSDPELAHRFVKEARERASVKPSGERSPVGKI